MVVGALRERSCLIPSDGKDRSSERLGLGTIVDLVELDNESALVASGADYACWTAIEQEDASWGEALGEVGGWLYLDVAEKAPWPSDPADDDCILGVEARYLVWKGQLGQ